MQYSRADQRRQATAPRSPWISLLLVLATVAGGLLVRFAPLGLPQAVVKYGGSILWAMLVYWLVSAMLRTTPPLAAAGVSLGVAVAVECFKLYRTPGLDTFRRTLPGVLLLGRFFSAWDIVAYGGAIGIAAWVDWQLRRRCPQPS